jgi:serine/threonine protein kinase
LHRDLKPSNVLISAGVPLVADFGIAKQIDVDGTTLTRTAQELGTLRYIAPEQSADAKRAGMAADVYALGKILAHMLTGREPVPLRSTSRTCRKSSGGSLTSAAGTIPVIGSPRQS